MSDHIDAALDGAGVCDGGRDGAGVCLLLLVVDAISSRCISGRAAALAAGPLHVNFVVPFLLRYTALVSTQLPGQRTNATTTVATKSSRYIADLLLLS